MKKRLAVLLALLLLSPVFFPSSARADNNALILRGVAKILVSAFELPRSLLANSTKAFPFGLVAGTLNGAVRTVMGTLSGGLDIARGGAPYAKYAALAL